jgi:hypothetical protein
MGTRQVSLCWPAPGCSVSGYSSMSLVSALSGHAEGTDTLQLLVTLCLQKTRRLSDTVAHLDRSPRLIRWDRPLSGSVVVSLGGQAAALDRRFGVKARLTVDRSAGSRCSVV